jgi:ABC-type multidrug transport system ATPase subunit
MITGTSPISGGELREVGHDIRQNSNAINSVLGVVSQADRHLSPGLGIFGLGMR